MVQPTDAWSSLTNKDDLMIKQGTVKGTMFLNKITIYQAMDTSSTMNGFTIIPNPKKRNYHFKQFNQQTIIYTF
jgi:hypothetical protein